MSVYAVHSITDGIQGVGGRAGCRSVFVSFSGCNLWSGRVGERKRGLAACAAWCDAAFLSGEHYTEEQMLASMNHLWPAQEGHERWCVLTGGEPLQQIDSNLLIALRADSWHIAVETNGSVAWVGGACAHVEWVTVSPKRGAYLALEHATEVIVALPGAGNGFTGWSAAALAGLERQIAACAYYVQPVDLNSDDTDAVSMCLAWVHAHPHWRVSARLNALLGLE